MKAIIKENGNETILKEGTFDEVREYLASELDNLLDWLEEEGNQWENFTEMKDGIKEKIKVAETAEEIEQAFEGINNEMSWWGVYFE